MPLPRSPSRPARTQIENLSPVLDCGRYRPKRTLGQPVVVSADVFRDGHELLGAELRYRRAGSRSWLRAPMEPDGADRFSGAFLPAGLGRWQFVVEAWVDRAASWRRELSRKLEAGQEDLSSELAEGAELLRRPSLTLEEALADASADRSEVVAGPLLEVDVDRERARVGAWYELFPRSFGGFRGVEAVLPVLAELGFDVVYLPPIHPIGRTNRKGRNNALVAAPGDPGSPWAIGAAEGGHTAVDPALGTLADFERLVARGAELGVEVALDYALQCSPDHPWLREHPDWFHRRPDGTLKYAENPPKRYQDIYNLNFDSEDWRGLWAALLEIVLFWIGRGVRIFRVDNPHTKPLPFWQWLIEETRAAHPDTVFLAEAFTRPVPMAALAKAGFSQSYTYFTWKNTKAELSAFMLDLTRPPLPEFFRPNFFVNTPDILHEYLQAGGRPAFEARLVLAATLSPSYGLYSGFENLENVAVEPGSEEYLDSEKYELKQRSLDGPLLPLVQLLHEARRGNAALRRLENLVLLETRNDELLGYAKQEPGNAVLVCVNLDAFAPQRGLVSIPAELGLPPSFRVADLLSGQRFEWQTGQNYVALDPGKSHLLVVQP